MRPEAITRNEDGTATVRGGGWFWATFGSDWGLLAMAPGMERKPAHRGFLRDARATLERVGFFEKGPQVGPLEMPK